MAVTIHADTPPVVAPLVVIGFVDIAAVGLRALACVASSASSSDHPGTSSSSRSVTPLRITTTDAGTLTPVLSQAAEGPCSHAACLCNLGASNGGAPLVSLVLLNFVVDQRLQAPLAVALLEWLQARCSGGPDGLTVVVAAGMLLNLPARSKATGVHALLLNEPSLAPTSAAASLPQLPPSTSLRDGFLASLVHVLQVSGQPSYVLAVPAHRPPVNGRLRDTEEAVAQLAAAVATEAGLRAPGGQGDLAASPAFQLERWWFSGEAASQADSIYT